MSKNIFIKLRNINCLPVLLDVITMTDYNVVVQ